MPLTAPATSSSISPKYSLLDRFLAVRSLSRAWSALLSPEDQMVQSCPEASPVKWHLAHTTWFFETFLLREFLPDYAPFDPDFHWLFNSYYQALGQHPEKSLRASFSRPSLGQVLDYRATVEQAIGRLLASLDTLPSSVSSQIVQRMEIGFHHEQQHQELIATDIKHAFFTNPRHPILRPFPGLEKQVQPAGEAWQKFTPGLTSVGYSGDGFAFDNETPRHHTYLDDFELSGMAVTCAEYLAFMEDGGYATSALWLSDGWDAVETRGWEAPLYWRKSGTGGGAWEVFTFNGFLPVALLADTPVCHLSYYEAEAYAHWAGHRLPTEFEWEAAATVDTSAPQFLTPERLDSAFLHPTQQSAISGAIWQWTRSAYLPYPGYVPLDGALGEYNGKFMSGQMVLRGGSVATPAEHMRPTYRNFFRPDTRWQFSGIRLARTANAGGK